MGHRNFVTVSHETLKTLQMLSAPCFVPILLVQERDDWLVHSTSVRGAASLLRKRLSPSDPEPVIDHLDLKLVNLKSARLTRISSDKYPQLSCKYQDNRHHIGKI